METLFNVKVKAVNTQRAQGQEEDLQEHPGAAERHQARDRDPRGRAFDRRDDGAVGEPAMALKTFRPTTPSLRQLVQVDREPSVEGRADQGADRGQDQVGRAQQLRPHHHAPHRRRPQAGLPPRRLQAHQARHSGQGRAAGVRSQPHGLHRPPEVQGRHARLYPGAPTPGRGRQRRRRHQGGREARQRHAACLHADRHHRPQHRAQGRRRRQDRALGGRLRPAGRPRRGLGDSAPQLGRDAARARRVHGDRGGSLQSRPHERGRPARPAARAGAAPVRPCARSP